ncbi:MAG: diguanylate cyclase [Nitrospinae bacterium]|nr:diguanylate cyclase [Nitrospinota bacterium]
MKSGAVMEEYRQAAPLGFLTYGVPPLFLSGAAANLVVGAPLSAVLLGGASVALYLIGAASLREVVGRERMTRNLVQAQQIGRLGCWEWNITGGELFWTDEADRIFGFRSFDMRGDIDLLLQAIHPDDRERFNESLRRTAATGESLDLLHRTIGRQGVVRYVHTRAEAIIDRRTLAPVAVTGAVHDISSRVHEVEKLRLHAAVFENTSEGILIMDRYGVIEAVNPAFLKMTGHTKRELLGGKPGALLEKGRGNESFYHPLWERVLREGCFRGEVATLRKDGTIVPTDLYVNTVLDWDGSPLRFVAIYTDITARKEYEENLKRLLVTDPLTGVANRRAYDEQMDEEWRRGIRHRTELCLLMIDIDHFKTFNDTFGHQEGDRCLRLVAQSIRSVVNRAGDLVARYGGEEFGVILPETSLAEGAAIAEKMREAVAHDPQGVAFERWNRQVTVSIGVAAVVPTMDYSPSFLIGRADIALYRAKSDGRNRVVTTEMTEHRQE